ALAAAPVVAILRALVADHGAVDDHGAARLMTDDRLVALVRIALRRRFAGNHRACDHRRGDRAQDELLHDTHSSVRRLVRRPDLSRRRLSQARPKDPVKWSPFVATCLTSFSF